MSGPKTRINLSFTNSLSGTHSDVGDVQNGDAIARKRSKELTDVPPVDTIGPANDKQKKRRKFESNFSDAPERSDDITYVTPEL